MVASISFPNLRGLVITHAEEIYSDHTPDEYHACTLSAISRGFPDLNLDACNTLLVSTGKPGRFAYGCEPIVLFQDVVAEEEDPQFIQIGFRERCGDIFGTLNRRSWLNLVKELRFDGEDSKCGIEYISGTLQLDDWLSAFEYTAAVETISLRGAASAVAAVLDLLSRVFAAGHVPHGLLESLLSIRIIQVDFDQLRALGGFAKLAAVLSAFEQQTRRLQLLEFSGCRASNSVDLTDLRDKVTSTVINERVTAWKRSWETIWTKL